MSPHRYSKIGILFFLLLIIAIVLYTQSLVLNSSSQSLSTSAKTYNQTIPGTLNGPCNKTIPRCNPGLTCIFPSFTCISSSSTPPVSQPTPTTSSPTTVVPTGSTSSPALPGIPPCTGQPGDEGCEPIRPPGGGLSCHTDLYPVWVPAGVKCVRKEYFKKSDFSSILISLTVENAIELKINTSTYYTIKSFTLNDSSLKIIRDFDGLTSLPITPDLPDKITGKVKLWIFSSAIDLKNAGDNPSSPPLLEVPFSLALYKMVDNNRYFLTSLARFLCLDSKGGIYVRLQDKYYLAGLNGFYNPPRYFYCQDAYYPYDPIYGEAERKIALVKSAPYDKVCLNNKDKTIWISKDQCISCLGYNQEGDYAFFGGYCQEAGVQSPSYCDLSRPERDNCATGMRCKIEPGDKTGICVPSSIP